MDGSAQRNGATPRQGSPLTGGELLVRPRQARSIRTRRRIIAATLQCLGESGYQRTTVKEVCVRAGVSRGALLHHFPTKDKLVAQAIEYGFNLSLAQHNERLQSQARDGDDRLARIVDVLWLTISGPAFAVWLELVVAARTDERLRDIVAHLASRFSGHVDNLLRELLPDDEYDWRAVPTASMHVLALMNGLMLDRMLGINENRINLVLDALPAALEAPTLRSAVTPRGEFAPHSDLGPDAVIAPHREPRFARAGER